MAVRGLSPAGRHRAVLLDALGTLVELEPPAPRLRSELQRRLGLSVSEREARHAMKAEMAYYREHLGEGRDERSLAGLRRRCAQVLWRELGGDPHAPDPECQLVVEVLMSSLSFVAFQDAPAMLAALKELGIVLIVVSNWDVSLPAVLERVGLAGHVDAVLTSAQFGVPKPERAIFDRALELAGATAQEAIHVGDGLREDVEGARGAGIEPVLLARSGGKAPPGVTRIGSLSELPGLLMAAARSA